jgi:MinD superfamily P-loop ATPase
VVSGKGGTGKTSLVASFVALAKQAAAVDCDVDAADLHLVLSPTVLHEWPVADGRLAVIHAERCDNCGRCFEVCRFGGVRVGGTNSGRVHEIDPVACEGCGVCVDACSQNAVALVATVNGEWFISRTAHGPMVHARLGVAQENSGKLVSLLRREAQALCRSKRVPLVLCDGAPGVGCPVIASIAGARMVLVVTEPTLSGVHDLERVAELCEQLGVRAGVCINKADINPEMSDRIEVYAADKGMVLLGRVRYDKSVTTAQIKQMPVVETGDAPVARDIRAVWERLQEAVS